MCQGLVDARAGSGASDILHSGDAIPVLGANQRAGRGGLPAALQGTAELYLDLYVDDDATLGSDGLG